MRYVAVLCATCFLAGCGPDQGLSQSIPSGESCSGQHVRGAASVQRSACAVSTCSGR